MSPKGLNNQKRFFFCAIHMFSMSFWSDGTVRRFVGEQLLCFWHWRLKSESRESVSYGSFSERSREWETVRVFELCQINCFHPLLLSECHSFSGSSAILPRFGHGWTSKRRLVEFDGVKWRGGRFGTRHIRLTSISCGWRLVETQTLLGSYGRLSDPTYLSLRPKMWPFLDI